MFAERMSLVAMPLAISAARTAAADLLADESAAAFVEASAETVALKRTASGTTEIAPIPVTVMKRLSVVPAPLAGIARATTPATAATVTRDVIVRSFVSFIGQVSLNLCDLTKKAVQRDCEYNSS
jgi:hypothetical protein